MPIDKILLNSLKRIFLSVALLTLVCGSSDAQNKFAASQSLQKNQYHSIIKGTLATYASPPILSNGQVDDKKLIAQLKDIHANTYNWLIGRDPSVDNLDALNHFLQLARNAGLKVWVTLVPPSELPPSEPYRLDYDQWAAELAVLSKKEPNLVAWNIDDFIENLHYFTPEYVKEFTSRAHAINPKLAFVPTCYFQFITPSFVKNYSHLLDGILFPYRAGSDPAGPNLKDPTRVKSEIVQLRKMFRPDFPIIVDVYASRHSTLGSTTPEYVRKVIDASLKDADGVTIYRHQDPVKHAKKYKIIKEEFAKGIN